MLDELTGTHVVDTVCVDPFPTYRVDLVNENEQRAHLDVVVGPAVEHIVVFEVDGLLTGATGIDIDVADSVRGAAYLSQLGDPLLSLLEFDIPRGGVEPCLSGVSEAEDQTRRLVLGRQEDIALRLAQAVGEDNPDGVADVLTPRAAARFDWTPDPSATALLDELAGWLLITTDAEWFIVSTRPPSTSWRSYESDVIRDPAAH